MTAPKVFGIGFHKTGTTSLGLALEALGYRVAGKLGVHRPQIAREVEALARRELERHDAFQDNPWPLLYRQLDGWCAGSKFILTVRPTEEWIRSVVRHFGQDDTPMREWIYGVGHPAGHERRYIERYERHNEQVRAWFADRPDDLLVFRTGQGDGWEALCAFLGHDVPAREFPHGNSQSAREAKSARNPIRREARRRLRGLRGRWARLLM